MKKLIMVLVVMTATLVAIPGTASAADSPADCAGSNIFYQVEYTDGAVDSGCSNKNEVTRADNPSLLANTLHVSCSDHFGLDGSRIKSDLAGREVSAFLIVKGLVKGKTKTCGEGTPVPAGGVLGYGSAIAAIALVAGASTLVLRGRRRTATVGI